MSTESLRVLMVFIDKICYYHRISSPRYDQMVQTNGNRIILSRVASVPGIFAMFLSIPMVDLHFLLMPFGTPILSKDSKGTIFNYVFLPERYKFLGIIARLFETNVQRYVHLLYSL